MEKTEYEKISEYYTKISQYQRSNYRSFLIKNQLCDFFTNGEWIAGYILDKNDYFLTIIDVDKYYLENNDTKYQFQYSDQVTYFRKFTHPSSSKGIKERSNKNDLIRKLKRLQENENINIFQENISINNNPNNNAFDTYYFLRGILYRIFDQAINKSKDKSTGVEESFKILLIILEYLSQFYKYISNNFDDFINYKNEISNSELADLVLIEKKYAIFSFWEEANLLMNKIFLNNEEYLEWFIDSEKIFQKLIPSSPYFKKPDKKNFIALYNSQIKGMKNPGDYIYKTTFGQNLSLNKICDKNYYKEGNFINFNNNIKVPTYIIAYFIDYFFALGGFDYLFSMCNYFSNIYINMNILENLCLAEKYTNNFDGMFEVEKNKINSNMLKFMEELNEKNYNKFSKHIILNLFRKGCDLYPKIQKNNNIFFEELYLRYIIKLFIYNKNENKKIEALNDINNILLSIEYNDLFNEKKIKNQNNNIDELINDEKYIKRDKLIKEMNYIIFCSVMKNNKIIEIIFNNENINENILEIFMPILILMYNYFFGFEFPERNINEINQIKNLIFSKILNQIKSGIFSNNLNKIQKILCDFTQALTDEDKFLIFSEIKSIFYNIIYEEKNFFIHCFNLIVEFSCIAVQKNNKDLIGKMNNKNNLNFEEKIFYGLEMIYNFITEEQYQLLAYDDKQKKEMMNLSIDSIIKILSESSNRKIGILILLNKIYNAIQNQKDVYQHLLLLKKLFNFFNSNNSSYNNNLLDECLKNINLFLLLINELKEFLSKKQNDGNIIDINSIETNSNNLLDDNNNNIKIRIEAIFSLLPNYTRNNFDFKQVKEFIKLMVQNSEFTRNISCESLLNSINNFSKDFLFYINSDIFSKGDIFDITKFNVYKIYKQILLKINMINNPHFLSYNKDILVQIKANKDLDQEIKGIDTLWNLLLSEEQNVENNIINDITNFICESFFGVRIKNEKDIIKAYKNFYEDFINNVSQKLNSILISKKIKKNVKAINSLITLIKKIINKSKNINGEVIKNINELIPQKNEKKEDKENIVEFTFFGKKSLSDDFYFCDIKLKKDECFHTLRYTLSSLYKIPVNQISIIVYMNNLGKSELIPKNLEKIIKTSPLKQFNLINDFDNIYQELKGLFNFSQSKKKSSLLIHVKLINNIWEDIFKINIVNIIYNKSNLPKMFLSLLKGKEEIYTHDVLDLIKDNNDLYNKSITEDIKEKMKNNKSSESFFNLGNNNIFYINNIVTNLVEVINKNYKEFMKSNVLDNYIMKLNVINDDEYSSNNMKGLDAITDLNELFEKYKVYNNLIKIYKSICDNEKEENLLLLICFKIINVYYYVINDSNYINLNLFPISKNNDISINSIKNIYKDILENINEIIINNEKLLSIIIKSLISNSNQNNNNYINKIKSIFIFIFFESILKNKYSFINQKIKSLIIGILNNYNNNNNMNLFYQFLSEFYLSENTFNKTIQIFKEVIKNNNMNINNQRYEKNSKYFFDICGQIFSTIYENIKNRFNINDYINKILIPKIFNYTQFISQYFPSYSIFPQLIIGGACKLFSTILILADVNNIDAKKYSEFIFNNYIMPNMKENIISPENIFNIGKNNNNRINIYSNYCIKQASNLFITLLFKNNKNINNDYIIYLNKLNKLHNLCLWKGNLLSDWNLYYKNSEKKTGFIGLKNLGSTCYINTILQIFYNIPLLKDSLLQCETNFNGGKNSLYQLKKVFYCLNFLQSNFYTPNSFIENFDNEKLDPKIQMDAFEFLCNFLEKIESKLKQTENENLIKYFFMGIQNDILAFDPPCEHHRINQSNFYTIQLQVQNKLNLYDSLDAFIEGEKMEGDNCIFCEKCNKKLPAVKSQNFQMLPRILIFVLKRFEFNYNTMQKFKINDYYEFPLELNMNKYVQENTNNNLYNLKGIIIHSGSCESGHYYCYIYDNETKDWNEFNDTKVNKFDIKNLDIEAFGKNEIILDENGNKIEKENTRSAYMLFYEKKDFNTGINFNKIKAINDIKNINNNEDGFSLLNNNENNILYNDINNNNKPKLTNEEINDIIKPLNQEMYNYFLYRRLFSGEYHHFVLSLFINILNNYKISVNNKLDFNYNLCYNNNKFSLDKEIKNYKYERKNQEISNINNYLSRNKIIIINKGENNININNNIIQKEEEEKILEIFKYLIIYYFNVMIRSREKDYLGGTTDLIKYFINNYIFCADYLIEEFSNKNVLIEYMINCPSYDIKKLIVGIIYCAMINCVKSYENKMRAENNNKKIKKPKKEEKKIMNTQSQETLTDEELARRLQEEENQSWQYNYNKNNNNIEDNINPLERKYIPINVVKFIYNVLHLIHKIKFQNMNESRFLYLILYRFSTVTNKSKKFLLNKALVLEFLNILLFEILKQEMHDDNKIVNSMDKGCFKSSHEILSTKKEDINAIYDKSGAFHYENYISDLYFYLLSHNQKPKPKRPYFEGSFNFDNNRFIKALFFRINTRLDAEVFSYLIIEKCKNAKNYKTRIECILDNIFMILNRADYNENINYDVNSNRDIFNRNLYNNIDRNMIDYDNDIPKINPKYLLLILKKFILNSSENKKVDEFRIILSLTKIFKIIEENQKYYNYSILLIDFITELFYNNITILSPYISQFNEKIKLLIDWIRLNPISPELYQIEGLLMYKNENIIYNKNLSEKEKKIFDEKNMKKSEKRANKLIKILDYKTSNLNIINLSQNKFEYDYSYEALFDYTDFKFRKGDVIYYNKRKAIVKENLDELILIKIINEENINKNKDFDEVGYSIEDKEKIKFWVAKDDKNISVFGLE